MQNILKRLFVSWLLLASNAYAETQVMNGVDDGTVHIPLGHNFPYYGGVFTDAWMSSNGFIILYDPTKGYGNSNTGQSWCNTCPWGYSGGPPQGISNLSYMIAPLWTDLRHDTSVPDSGYFYETGPDGTWFEWRNVTEYATNNTSTFGLQLWPEGSFDFHYAEVNITAHNTWIGFTGDTTSQTGNVYDEVNELFYRTNTMQTSHVTNFTDAETNFGYAWWGQDGGYQSIDCSSPLNDPSCPGYDDAYFDQQCSANALYDPQCPGYEQAYFDQQCSADPLYNPQCPGYEQAYFDQQCSMDPLYDQQCPGYEQAYFDQQCGFDALYDPLCPGYEEAYYNQQCGLDALYDTGCPGYAEAYYDQQCGLNPLYDSGCPGYAEAYYAQQCELDGMYDTGCPNYAKSFLKFQCDIDPLFDVTCGGYAVAKAELDAKALAEQLQYEAEQQALEEQTRKQEEELKALEELYKEEQAMEESAAAIVTDDPITSLLTEEEAFLEEIEKIVEEAAPVEEKIEEKVVVEEIVEEEINEEPVIMEELEEIIEEDVADVASEKKLIDIDRVLEVMSDQEQNSQKMLAESAEMSVTSQNDPIFTASGRSERANALSQALGDAESDDNIAQDSILAATTSLQEQSESASEEILDDGGSTETMDVTFGEQMTQAFATGGNIGSFLSGEAPNLSRFDIKPPSKDEQRDTKKVESLAEEMSDQAIEQNIEKLKDEMQDSGGFDSNQAITLTLMGHVPSFNQYRDETLRDQNDWYASDGVYSSQTNVDNKFNLYKLMGTGDQKHREMVLEQYGR